MWALGGCLLWAGCERDIIVAELHNQASSPVPGRDAGTGSDANTSDAGGHHVGVTPGGPDDLCASPNAPLLPQVTLPNGDTTEWICADTLASTTMKFALCTCQTADLTRLRTDSFDSRLPDVEYARSGAAVGFNGGSRGTFSGQIGGSFTSRSSVPLDFNVTLDVEGDLRLDNVVAWIGRLTVMRDAWLRGPFTGGGIIDVGRNLHLWSVLGIRDFSFADRHVGGDTYDTERFAIAPPCPCNAGERADIAGIVQQAAQVHDNFLTQIDADAWRDVDGSATLALRCGRQYLTSVSVRGSLTIEVEGRAALFVTRDLAVGGTLAIRLGPEASLDLVVAGSLKAQALGPFGDRRNPRNLRVYVGGSDPITLGNTDQFGAGLYAPLSAVTVAGAAPLHGALFVSSVSAANPLELHYDRALSVDPGTCGAEDTCLTCDSCRGASCEDRACLPCQSDVDCCQPWVCIEDHCQPLQGEL